MSQKEKHPIWQHFDKSTTDRSKAVCKICTKVYSLGSKEPRKQTLHGLKLHLSKSHHKEYRQAIIRLSELNDLKIKAKLKQADLKESLKESSLDPSTLVETTMPSLIFNPILVQRHDNEITERIDKTIMDLIIVDMLPCTLVEGEAFRRLNFADPLGVHKYQLKSEEYFRTSLMPKTYERIRSKVQDLLTQSMWMSVTTDIWTNTCNTCSLLSFTAHFIIDDKRFKVILGACVLEQDHSSQYIAQKFTDIVHEWGLKGKIFLVLRDNVANKFCVCAMRDQYEVIGCVAHTLQLVIKEALFSEDNINDLLMKCRKIVDDFHDSEPASRKLTECQKRCGLPEHVLVQDIDMTWNSLYLMLQRLLEQENAINLYSDECDMVDSLQYNDWEIVKNLTSVLTFFHEAALELSFDNACISIVIPLIWLLNQKLQVCYESDNEMIINMKTSLCESMNMRFSSLKKLPSVMAATILDPRFKSKYLNRNEVDIAVTELISFLTESEVNMQSSHSTDNGNVSTASTTCVWQAHYIKQEKESIWDAHDNMFSQTEFTESKDMNCFLREKIQCYLSQPLLQLNADIYSYWSCSPYPMLRSAAVKYLSAPPTSGPSEQLSSAVGQIYSDRRNNLRGENVDQLLFLAYNIRLFNYDY